MCQRAPQPEWSGVGSSFHGMKRRAHQSALLAALITALIGLFALGTWQFGAWRLATFSASYVPMAPITAVLFVLLATAQGAWLVWPRPQLVRIGVALVTGLAAIAATLALVQAGTDRPLPWESWFNPAGGHVGVIPLGRMAPLTAMSFLLTAGALHLLVFARGAWRLGALPLAAIVLVTGGLVTAGYAAGTPISYSGETVPMALLTALGFVALGLSNLSAGPLAETLRHWLRLDAAIPAGAGPDRRSNRLLALLTLALTFVILLYGFFYVRSEQAAARETVQRELRSVSDLKTTQIYQWRQERLSEGRFLQRTPAIAEDIAAFLAQSGAPGRRERLLGWLEPIKAGDRYEQVLLFDPAGEIRLQLGAGTAGDANVWHHELKLAAGADRVAQPILTDLHRDQVEGRVHLSVIVPVFQSSAGGGAGEWLATLVLVMDPARALYPLLQSWPVPSETAEVFLVRHEGEEVVYLTELRHLEAPPLTVRRSTQELLLPAAMAVRGVAGIREGRDYRDQPVLTVANRIPDSPWWLIANIDQAEVYAPIRKEARQSGLMVFFLLLTVGLAAAFVWRQRHAAYLQHSLALEHERGALSERLATLMRYANDIILLLDEQGRIVEANERALTTYGYTLEELRALPAGGLRAKSSSGDLARQLDGLLQEGGAHFETIHRRRDGTEFPVEASGRAVEIGGRRYGLGIYRDITERKRVLEALRQSEERYRLLFDRNPVPMWLYDVETLRFIAVNETAVRNYGYTEEEFLKLTIAQIRPEEDLERFMESVHASRDEPLTVSEWRHRRKDGTILHVEVMARPLVFNDRPARLVMATDITEKKQLQEQFLRAQRLESLGMLASGIAHDLNNMLAPILFAGPLLRTSVSSPRDLRILETLEKSAERGSGLVRQILAFAQGTSAAPRITQLKHIARDVVSIVEASFPKNIIVEQHIATGAWPVQANPTQIHQVLLNLCVNARDAMPQGGTLSIRVSNRKLDSDEAAALPEARAGEWLVLEVADTGTGIPADIVPHIWDSFFTTKAPGKGTGLGLATVRSIVTAHLGFIGLETAVGKGTTFRVFLPASRDPEAKASESGSPFPVPATIREELILVVDDDASVREIIAAVLAQHDYRVITCADGIEAIVNYNAKARDIALVITDVDMPNLGGAILAATLRRLNPQLRIVAMSGLSSAGVAREDVEEIKRIAAAFLPKPFSATDLLAVVHRVLNPNPNP